MIDQEFLDELRRRMRLAGDGHPDCAAMLEALTEEAADVASAVYRGRECRMLDQAIAAVVDAFAMALEGDRSLANTIAHTVRRRHEQ